MTEYVSLSIEQIIAIHDYQRELYGGLEGIKEPGYLDLIVDKPFTEFYGEQQYPGLFLKAAVYMHGLATAHAFNDANKRTAVVVCAVFLNINGFPLNADANDELFSVALRVATKKMDLYDLADWLQENS